MSLFNFNEDRVEVTRELSLLKPFKVINEREDRDVLFSYIYHMYDWGSPYARLPKEERKDQLKEELFGEDDIPNDVLEPAIELYKELSKTHSLDLLESAREGVRELKKYFTTIRISASKSPGKEAKDLMSNLNNVGTIIKNLQEWEDVIKKEQDQSNIRKGVEINKFNKA